MPGTATTKTHSRPNLFLCALPLIGLALVLPSMAQAHVGAHGAGFAAGLAHPVDGADHVLAMLAVGLWAALTGGRALWAMPLAFVAALLAGGGLSAAGVVPPGVEPMILASVVGLGAAVALALRLPLPAALSGIAVFGFAHGLAHGAEGPAAGFAAYAAGFALATSGLHLTGLAFGLASRKLVGLTRAMGALTAAAGAVLALGVSP